MHLSPVLCQKIVPFLLSDIGEGIREVQVKEWFVSEGDRVAQFDSICEVQSDKASVTITSRYDGIVRKLHYGVDAVAYVGKPLIDIELSTDDGDSIANRQVDNHQGSEITPQTHADGGLSGSKEMQTRAIATPAVRRIAKENMVHLGDVIGTGKDGRVLKEDILAYVSKRQTQQQQQPVSVSATAASKVSEVAAPAAAAAPSAVAAPAGRGSTAEGGGATAGRGAAGSSRPQSAPPAREDRREPLKGIRKGMARAMSEALKIPHFGYCDEVDMGALVKLRSQLKDSPLLRGLPFSYMPIIIKATSLALLEWPILNSSLDASAEHIIYKAAHNIGVALDSSEGLIVPNVKNAQDKSVLEIADDLKRLMELGKSGKLGPADITGGTFSLSNIGSIGGTYAKPVILPPEVAIGALGKIQVLPRFDSSGTVVPAHIMQVSWSADHRVVEGAQMARFSNLWKSYLEHPTWMLLQLK